MAVDALLCLYIFWGLYRAVKFSFAWALIVIQFMFNIWLYLYNGVIAFSYLPKALFTIWNFTYIVL